MKIIFHLSLFCTISCFLNETNAQSDAFIHDSSKSITETSPQLTKTSNNRIDASIPKIDASILPQAIESTTREKSLSSPSSETTSKEVKSYKEIEENTTYQEMMSLLINAFQNKNWSIFIGLLLMLLVMLSREVNIIKNLDKKYIPWLATGMGCIGTISTSLMIGTYWPEAIMHGFLLGASATGLWELVFKHLFKK